MMLKDDQTLVETIRKAALLNAVQHDSDAQAGPIIGKILGEQKELRTKAKELTDADKRDTRRNQQPFRQMNENA